jgi:N-acetylglucosaminyldiphosphoundecaprenol N-acetyl-beta-D-mannosaminyltransferase
MSFGGVTTGADQPATGSPGPARVKVGGHPIDAVGNREVLEMVVRRALTREPGAFICLSNANNVVQSQSMPGMRAAAQTSFLSIPDGFSVAWILRRRGYRSTQKLGGPDLVPMLARAGREAGLVHMFYGWTERLGDAAAAGLQAEVPGTRVAPSVSPPFAAAQGFPDGKGVEVPPGTPLAPNWVDMGGKVGEVDWQLDELEVALRTEQPHILWVGLGSPVQEEWMSMLAGRLDVPVMIGVGRAFNYLAGTQKRCPRFMTRMGMEWLYTFLAEPRRLWRRYLIGNPRFVMLVARESAQGDKP